MEERPTIAVARPHKRRREPCNNKISTEEDDQRESEQLDQNVGNEATTSTVSLSDDFEPLVRSPGERAEEEDIFARALRCRHHPQPGDDESVRVLWWHSPAPYLPVGVEESMVSTLVRWTETERGMMKDQPEFRLRQVRNLCQQKRVPLTTALSLRRHLLKSYHPFLTMSQLRLGHEEDVRESARCFEEAVQQFLQQRQVLFWNEEQQKQHWRRRSQHGGPYPPTPDFLLQRPLLVKKFVWHHSKGGRKHRRVVEERSICWIEAKMFYGASIIEQDGKSAVGTLLGTAQKYTRFHGDGALVFMHGCGDRLADQLRELGVLVLDCSSDQTIRLDAVQEHQGTWCADRHGHILP